MRTSREPIERMGFPFGWVQPVNPKSQHATPCRIHQAIPKNRNAIERWTVPTKIRIVSKEQHFTTSGQPRLSFVPGTGDKNILIARWWTVSGLDGGFQVPSSIFFGIAGGIYPEVPLIFKIGNSLNRLWARNNIPAYGTE